MTSFSEDRLSKTQHAFSTAALPTLAARMVDSIAPGASVPTSSTAVFSASTGALLGHKMHFKWPTPTATSADPTF
eukprot:8629416-Alexandrium_andersonii.AAC.1